MHLMVTNGKEKEYEKEGNLGKELPVEIPRVHHPAFRRSQGNTPAAVFCVANIVGAATPAG